ncbi:MAG: 4Fe-4S binding protein [Deltaproteobacteria bacterium]|nr:4Fe-4S binding protein [Deltaproteobacteria bacterium]
MTKKGWKSLCLIRRLTGLTILVLLWAAFINPQSWEPVLKLLPKLQFGQLLAGFFSGGPVRIVIPFLIIVLSALFFGRFFCGFLCPLGASMDLAVFIRSKIKRKTFAFIPDRWWRSLVPVLLLGTFWVGLTIPMGQLEPYSIIISGLFPLLPVLLIIAAWRGRAFCNSVCPTGWVLKILAKSAIFGFFLKKDTCLGCGSCRKVCPASCIDSDGLKLDRGRCLICLQCAAVCPNGSLTFGAADVLGHQAPGRRNFLRLTAAATAVGGAYLTGEEIRLSSRPLPETAPILPPGALSVAHLNAHCTLCHSCVQACPNGALEPADDADDIRLLGKPIISPYLGFCQYECVLCTQICPTGALVPLTPEVKRTSRLGTASLNLSECVVIKNHTSCGACAELCPSGAVNMVLESSELPEPFLEKEFCIGCGACQKACPVRPVAAIVVEGLYIQQTAKPAVQKKTTDSILADEFPF